MRKKRVLFATNYLRNDTTSYLRAYGPFTLLRDYVEIVEPKIPDVKTNLKYGWWSDWTSWFNNIDVCFMHRPFGPVAAHIMANCKLHGIPLWVDHDDDLSNIPKTNPFYKIHSDGEKEFPSVEMSYKYADVLTCSGEVMHERLKGKYGRQDAILITSGLDDRLLRFKQPFGNNRKVAWRGSTSHESDLRIYEASLKRVVRENPSREFIFWGMNPEDLWPEFKKYPNWMFEVQMNHLEYLTSLTKQNCTYHHVPLEDNEFNRVKSNLAWLDATLAGSVVLGPNFPEWQRPGILHYDDTGLEGSENPNGYGKKLDEFLQMDRDQLEGLHRVSWEYICDNLLQSKLNFQRLEILKNL